ncbi:MAG: HAD-IIA family hydrolase [Melioribacteraceae bacterium]|nr:HAD-IIA family hydrolase [Melioribacteraceae bacterium]MCF8394703.1 HAD-IIA family hydrolase [Melioribacteraceae bacterium]MCF8418088.1 HAD-IIA family hydrolase [Melioribacteraceae bacterium]
MAIFESYEVILFDLDGTIYRGNKLIPNADKTVNFILEKGKTVLFVSNKTTGTVNDYYNLLKNFEIHVNVEQFINATVVIENFLLEYHRHQKFFAIGEKVFVDELVKKGMNYSSDPSEIDIVIITLDRTFNYEKLEIAAKALESGARFYAANIDNTCPVEGGEITDAGAVISALEKRTGKILEKHFGKPSKFLYKEILKRVNGHRRILQVGDRVETDIAMGNKFGFDTALVSTGVKHFNENRKSHIPTYTINSVFDLIK